MSAPGSAKLSDALKPYTTSPFLAGIEIVCVNLGLSCICCDNALVELMMEADLRLVTSIRVQAGCCDLLDLHLDRLLTDASMLDVTLDRERLRASIESTAKEWTGDLPARLRVSVAREGRWTIEKPAVIAFGGGPLKVMLHPHAVDSHDVLLRHRTSPRPVYDAAYAAAQRLGFVDVIFTNECGMVTEGAVHNLFVRKGGRWRTPPLSAGVLPGVYRRHLLESDRSISEENITIDELHGADEIRLTSAIHGSRRVELSSTGEKQLGRAKLS